MQAVEIGVNVKKVVPSQPHYHVPEILKFSEIDKSIVDAIWYKAAKLVHAGYITKIPGDHEGKGRMVASSSSSHSCQLLKKLFPGH
jgi:hypothetical protein